MDAKLPYGFLAKNIRTRHAEYKMFYDAAAVLAKEGFCLTGIPALGRLGDNFGFYGMDDRYKLTDSEGDILALTEDVVEGLLSLAEKENERLFGMSEVYRFSGAVRNRTSFGAVITGISGIEAEAEAIACALGVLKAIGIECGKIVLGNTSVLLGLAESIFQGKVGKDKIRSLLKNELFTDADYAVEKLIRETALVKGGLPVLKQAAEKITNPTSTAAMLNLLELSGLLEEYGLGNLIEYDLANMGRNYDNGTVFLLCDKDGKVLIEGGRHDFMRSGEVCRAVSFRFDPEYLLTIYPGRYFEEKTADAVIGVADATQALKAAFNLKKSLTENGLTVKVIYKTGKDETAAFAVASGVESAIYVDAEGHITVNGQNDNKDETNAEIPKE